MISVRKLKPIQPGHVDVDKYNIHRIPPRRFQIPQRVLGVDELNHLGIRRNLAQVAFEKIPIRVAIIDQKDLWL